MTHTRHLQSVLDRHFYTGLGDGRIAEFEVELANVRDPSKIQKISIGEVGLMLATKSSLTNPDRLPTTHELLNQPVTIANLTGYMFQGKVIPVEVDGTVAIDEFVVKCEES
jgi:hypothetical protein